MTQKLHIQKTLGAFIRGHFHVSATRSLIVDNMLDIDVLKNQGKKLKKGLAGCLVLKS